MIEEFQTKTYDTMTYGQVAYCTPTNWNDQLLSDPNFLDLVTYEIEYLSKKNPEGFPFEAFLLMYAIEWGILKGSSFVSYNQEELQPCACSFGWMKRCDEDIAFNAAMESRALFWRPRESSSSPLEKLVGPAQPGESLEIPALLWLHTLLGTYADQTYRFMQFLPEMEKRALSTYLKNVYDDDPHDNMELYKWLPKHPLFREAIAMDIIDAAAINPVFSMEEFRKELQKEGNWINLIGTLSAGDPTEHTTFAIATLLKERLSTETRVLHEKLDNAKTPNVWSEMLLQITKDLR